MLGMLIKYMMKYHRSTPNCRCTNTWDGFHLLQRKSETDLALTLAPRLLHDFMY